MIKSLTDHSALMTSCPPALYYLYYEKVQSRWGLKSPVGNCPPKTPLVAPMNGIIGLCERLLERILMKILGKDEYNRFEDVSTIILEFQYILFTLHSYKQH